MLKYLVATLFVLKSYNSLAAPLTSGLHTQVFQPTQYDAPSAPAFHQPSATISNDHHGGVSIVGAGGSAQKGTTLDLTHEGGPAHTGLFGGSFISTGSHGKTGGYYQGGGDHDIETAFNAGLSSYDVGQHHVGLQQHDQGEVAPVLYSSVKDEHSFGAATFAQHGPQQFAHHF